MRQETKNILLKLDEIDSYETPSDFNYRGIKSNVAKLLKDLIDRFDAIFSVDDQVQDASFYCDIKVPIDLVINPKPQIGYSIRISNFGQLATINFESEYSESTVKTIIQSLELNGFTYISADDLNEDYDGNFSDFHNLLGGETPSWWIRYFDYL